MSRLRTNVADLLHHPGARRPLRAEAGFCGLQTGGAAVPVGAPVRADVVLERIPEGILVHGTIAGRFGAECSRCLTPIERDFEVGVRELFEAEPVDGETYPLEGDELDLEPLVRDAVLLELPNQPRCRDGCAGLCPVCGADRNREPCGCDTTVRDERWSALENLNL